MGRVTTQHMVITVGQFYLTHPVNFAVGGNWNTQRKPTALDKVVYEQKKVLPY